MKANQINRKFLKPTSISDRLKCPICFDVFLNPLRISCGHTFCESCLESFIRTSDKCPQCREEIDGQYIGIDVLATQIINELEVLCPMSECPWKGQYQILRLHLEQQCLFKYCAQMNSQKFDPHKIIDEQIEQQINKNTVKGSLTSRIAASTHLYRTFLRNQSRPPQMPIIPEKKAAKVINLQEPQLPYHEYEFFDPNAIKFGSKNKKKIVKKTKRRMPIKTVQKKSFPESGKRFLQDLFENM